MKTLIDNETRTSFFVGDDSEIITFKDGQIIIGPLDNPSEIVGCLDENTATLIEGAAIPADWEAGKYRILESGYWLNANVPEVISDTQAKKALHRKDSGLRGQIKSVLAQPGNEEAEIDWEGKDDFHRDGPAILALAAHPGIDLTSEEVDDIFIAGDQI